MATDPDPVGASAAVGAGAHGYVSRTGAESLPHLLSAEADFIVDTTAWAAVAEAFSWTWVDPGSWARR